MPKLVLLFKRFEHGIVKEPATSGSFLFALQLGEFLI